MPAAAFVKSVCRLAYQEKAVNFALLFLERKRIGGKMSENVTFYEITTQFSS